MLASLLIALAPFAAATEPEISPSGIYQAEEVPDSPKLTSSGMVWWKDRLIIAERVGKRLDAFTPPNKFETLREIPRAVGLGVDPGGNLIVAEKEPTRILQITPEGKEKALAEVDTGTPHFVTVHKNGTIYWSGFPDGGTRSLAPGAAKVAVHTPRIVHTYGIGLSPKQDFMYVASKIPNPDQRGVWRFPLDEKGVPGEGKIFFKTQELKPDLPKLPAPKDGDKTLLGWVGRLQGLTVDSLGNIYIAGAESHNSGEAVAVIDPTGKKVIAMILGVPRNISGLAFGGKDGRTLYITGAGEYKLFRVTLPAGGW